MDAAADEILAAFGARVRAARLTLGLSQPGLAAKSGLHHTYISTVERGKCNVGLSNLLLLAWALEVDASELLAD